jgi:hypothetical protein
MTDSIEQNFNLQIKLTNGMLIQIDSRDTSQHMMNIRIWTASPDEKEIGKISFDWDTQRYIAYPEDENGKVVWNVYDQTEFINLLSQHYGIDKKEDADVPTQPLVARLDNFRKEQLLPRLRESVPGLKF